MTRILVVDDLPQNLDYLNTLFGAHGYEVLCAVDGTEALRLAREQVPDLVVSDLLMPVLDGYSLLREWRADLRLRTLPFIVYSSTYTDEEDQQLAQKLGADAFLMKPCEPEVLLGWVRKLLLTSVPPAPQHDAAVASAGEVVMERYSRVLIRKLEERSNQLEAANRELRHDVDERRRSAAALRASEARLRAIIDAEPECVKLVSVDGRLLEMNPAGLRMVEAENAGQVLGKSVLGLVHPEDREAFMDLHLFACAGQSGELEFRIIGLRGTERWMDMHSTPLREGDGSVTAVLSVTRDITERRRATENERTLLRELDAERARLVVAQRIAKIGNWETDLDAGSVTWSEEMHRIFETNPAAFQPNLKSLLQRVHGEDRAAAERAFKESLRHPGGQFRIEHRIDTGAGRIKYVEQRWEVVGAGARARLVFGTTRDISEQHAAARALQAEHERLLEAQRVARLGSWEVDLASDQVQWSEQTHRLFETDPDRHQPTYDDFFGRLHPEDRALLQGAYERSLADPTRAVLPVQYRVPFADGRIKHLETQWQVYAGADGVPSRVLGTVRDITEQKQAEAAEKRSTALFAAIAEHMPDQLVVKDLDLRCTYINDLALQLIGKRREELLGRPLTDFMTPEQGALLEAHDREVLDSGQRITRERTYTFGGAERVFLTTKAPLRDADGRTIGIIGVAHEITERKHIEALLQQSEERFREMAENVGDVFYNYDPTAGKMLYLNPAFERVFGRPLAESRDNPHAYLDCVHPDDLEAVLAAFDAQLHGTRGSSEFRILRPDGEVRHVQHDAVPILAADGHVERIVGSMRDVTARKLADLKLRQSLSDLDQRNKELREFAFVASHDLQEPLRKIRAFSELVVSRYREALPEPGRDYLDRMHQAAGRMQVLIDDLLEYSRINTGGAPFRDVDLQQVCGDVLNDLDQRVRASDAQVRVAPLPHLRGDPTQMRQLFQNLLANALKFRREGVRPEIEVACSAVEIDGVPGVRIEVADNGIGFEQEHAERIFAPFQRLHSRSEYEGSGIGLSIVRRIVARHRGRIHALGTPGAGARFIIDLPSALDAPDSER